MVRAGGDPTQIVRVTFSDHEAMHAQPRWCRRCGYKRSKAFGLCRACYQYRYRNGVDRPWELILAAAERERSRVGV